MSPMRRALSRMISVASLLVIAALAFWVPFRPLHVGGPEGPSLDLEPVWGLKIGLLERRPVSQGPSVPDAYEGGFFVERTRTTIIPPDPEFTRYRIQSSAWESSLGPTIQKHYTLVDYLQTPCIRGTKDQPIAIGTWREIRFPYWVVLLVSLAPPVIQTVRAIRAKRLRDRLAGNQCLRCGYDLRATPTRCPECGLEVAPVATDLPAGSAPVA
jgi:hypothetical protein